MKSIVKAILSASIAAFIIIAVVYIIGPTNFLNNITKINPLWILPLFIIYSFDWLLRGFRWKLILKQNNYEVPVSSAISLSLLGNFANLVIPAKLGDLVWMYGAKKKHKIRFSVAFTTVILDRFCDFLAVIILALLSMFFLVRMNFPEWVYYLLYVGIAVAFLFVVFVFLIIKYKKLMKKVIKVGKLRDAISKISDALFHSTRSLYMFAFFILLSLVVWLLETLTAYIVASLLGAKISFAILLFAIIVANITKTIPITPADIGVYEGVLATVLFVSGISLNLGLTIALVDHIVKILYVLIAGSFVTSFYGINVFKKNENKT